MGVDDIMTNMNKAEKETAIKRALNSNKKQSYQPIKQFYGEKQVEKTVEQTIDEETMKKDKAEFMKALKESTFIKT